MDGVQCKKCRYLLKNKDGYNWCPNKIDDPDIDLIRDCEWYAVKTNADRIRSMTDEELAENLMKSYDCPKGKDCVEQMPGEDGFQQCKRCWVEWLRQECAE